ncbi:DUF4238 domain-containing protein [Lacinutrix sp. Hel_I_90]|uniref:DUF4238 domain-containing protein n=1 Tax=Lacinutrix sp. Hel_I_90 TaxID=1249999 RepID=UPI0005CADA26|nr:DUF4238 domain-containing protein [Lacinutrix sp. Hel_I_90]
MGQYKKHHYVPRFYLKRFSFEEKGLHIGVFNHQNDVFVRRAPIKHQAAKNYLYGKDDEVELYLSKLESKISKLFHFWTNEKILVPPNENTNADKLLKRFILYQYFRTPRAGDLLNITINDTFRVIAKKYYPKIWEKIKESKLVNSDPVLTALLHSSDKEHLLGFLSCKFLVNLSYLPFITSDAPVIFYNQFKEKTNQYNGATALVSKGLQIFYPIHPRLMICYYDTKEYNYGKSDNNNCISTDSVEDVHQLNSLQYLNSSSQVFFNQFIEEDYINLMLKEFKKQKNDYKVINKLFKTMDSREFLYNSFENYKIDLSLTFTEIIQKSNINNDSFEVRDNSFL